MRNLNSVTQSMLPDSSSARITASCERLKHLATIAAKQQRVSTTSRDGVPLRFCLIRQPSVPPMVCFSPNRLRSRFDHKGQVAKCDRTQTTDSITKKGIMDTEKNPNEREKQGGGKQGG